MFLQEGFEYLEASSSKSDTASNEFNDARVSNLWSQVEQGNFSDAEKASFKVSFYNPLFDHFIASG